MTAGTESYALRGQVRLWTRVEGEGVPVVFCNGGPGCCDYLKPVAQMLDGRAKRIRFEAAGCGRSDHAEIYDVASCVADLEAVRQYLGIEQWIVAGHSWGADLALIYAMHHPDVVLGCVCLAGGRMVNDREWHRIYAEKRDLGMEKVPDFDFPYNAEVNRQVNRSAKEYIQRPGLWHDLVNVDKPVLFVYGDQDIRPVWPVAQLAALIPDAELEMLAGANHFLWETHPDSLSALLIKFVQRLAA
jgi:proline iminopeptidase